MAKKSTMKKSLELEIPYKQYYLPELEARDFVKDFIVKMNKVSTDKELEELVNQFKEEYTKRIGLS